MDVIKFLKACNGFRNNYRFSAQELCKSHYEALRKKHNFSEEQLFSLFLARVFVVIVYFQYVEVWKVLFVSTVVWHI